MQDCMGYEPLVAALREAFGMTFTLYDTSGGNYCLRAVTETGHWLHITDAYEDLSTFYEREHAWRHDGACYGFGVSVFADDECGELVYSNEDPFAVGDTDVVTLVRDALENLAGRTPDADDAGGRSPAQRGRVGRVGEAAEAQAHPAHPAHRGRVGRVGEEEAAQEEAQVGVRTGNDE